MAKALEGMQQMLQAANAEIMQGINKRSAGGSAYESFVGFYHAIDWVEPLLLCIGAWHLSTVLAAFVTRNHTWTHAALFLALCGQVLLAETVNHFGALHWRAIASQDYFDKAGMFVSVLLSLPTVLILLGMLINMVRTAGDLLVQAKVAELKSKRRSAAAPAGESAVPSQGTPTSSTRPRKAKK
jgi:hypothetical protein